MDVWQTRSEEEVFSTIWESFDSCNCFDLLIGQTLRTKAVFHLQPIGLSYEEFLNFQFSEGLIVRIVPMC